jgi:DUF1680 family protein
MYRSTGDAAFRQRIEAIVPVLAECQTAAAKAGYHEGYLSAFPESFIDRVEARKEVWAPWYTLHKLMAGLLDAHLLAGNREALVVLEKMAGWARFRVEHLTREQMQASLETEHGGMAEVLANLSAVTHNPEHLKLAQAFDHAAILDPLAHGEDRLDGLHANTQIPKIIGAAREYELTGDPRYRKIAETFWERVALHRSYAIGGHSDREHFFPVDEFERHVSPETTETCNTYNMLKLTRHLFAWQPDARWMDFYERALYNHILASQDPAQGNFVYLLSLEPGHFKTYSTTEDSFWCCVGTGMENHAKYGEAIYAHDTESLYVNLFIASALNWRARGVHVRQETRFPDEDLTRLTVTAAQAGDFTLKLRHPSWADGPLSVSINGEAVSANSRPGSYLALKRTWRAGDQIVVRFPFALKTEPLPGSSHLVAVLYGPIVLAGRLGIDGMPNPYARDQLDQARFPHPAVPVFVTESPDWLDRVEMLSRTPLLFRTRGLARPQDVTLAPLYLVNHERYNVYWKTEDAARWAADQAAVTSLAARRKQLSDRAVDRVLAGDSASEAAHAFAGNKSDAGTVGGHSWREARHGGSFSYELTVRNSAEPLALVSVVSSRDKTRKYTLVIDGEKVAPLTVDNDSASEFALQVYPLSQTPTGRVTVKVAADEAWDAASANIYEFALVPQSAARP